MSNIGSLKRQLTDLEQQEEEEIRELEMERSLLNGEWSAEEQHVAKV